MKTRSVFKAARRPVSADAPGTQLAPQIDRVSVDRGQFEQALVNMIVNARDAMPTGGRLTLRTAALDLIEVDHEDGTDYSGPGVELAIEDTGTTDPPPHEGLRQRGAPRRNPLASHGVGSRRPAAAAADGTRRLERACR